MRIRKYIGPFLLFVIVAAVAMTWGFTKWAEHEGLKQSKMDAAKLDALLAGTQINRIEIIYPFTRTNVLVGENARDFLLSFSVTNRIASPDIYKTQVLLSALFASGTNEVCWLSQYENGLWKFGDYSFQLRSSP